jgi:hypothetical protein
VQPVLAGTQNHAPAIPATNPATNPAATDPTIPQTHPNLELLDQVTLITPGASTTWRYAAGLNAAWSIRKDYGARTFRRFEPEAIGYVYTALPRERLWLRHGARLGYSNDQPQMPKSVRMEEQDWKLSVEEGVIYNSYLVPSLAFGVGYDFRSIQVKTSSPLQSSDDRLDTRESFFWYYLQTGLGLPALKGEYLLEPVLRWQHLRNDQRTNWAFGLEITKAW